MSVRVKEVWWWWVVLMVMVIVTFTFQVTEAATINAKGAFSVDQQEPAVRCIREYNNTC